MARGDDAESHFFVIVPLSTKNESILLAMVLLSVSIQITAFVALMVLVVLNTRSAVTIDAVERYLWKRLDSYSE